MAVRRESVEITVTDELGRSLLEDAAAARLLIIELDRLQGKLDSTAGSARLLRTQLDGLNGPLIQNTQNANRGAFGMQNLLKGAVSLAPALIPITSGLVPAVAGLSAGLVSAAGAFGVTLLAVHGLGDGLKAINAYQLEPTAANLAKVQQELTKLGPAGAEFSVYLDQVGSRLSVLQGLARQGIFPGVEKGIDALLTRLPEVKSIVQGLSEEVGRISTESGQALGGPKFDAFFNYLDTRAAPILHDFAEAAGNVAEGLANLLVGVDPLTKSFTGGLVSATDSFAKWSRGLQTNQGFQQFIAYAQENGPKVLDLLGSIGHAFGGIISAAKPVGDVVLPALTDLFNIIGNIADSDLGKPLYIAAAAASAYSLALKGVLAAQVRVTTAGAAGSSSGLLGGGIAGFIGARGAAIRAAGSNIQGYGLLSAVQSRNMGLVRAETASLAKNVGLLGGATLRAGAPIAGLALATSGLGKSFALTDTASYALIGTMAGPWGAALGAAAGATQDFLRANNGLADSIKGAQSAATSGGSITDLMASRNALTASLAAATNDDSGPFGFSGKFNRMSALLQGDIGKTTDAASALDAKISNTIASAAGLSDALGMTTPPLDGSVKSAEKLQTTLEAAAPAMQRAGITQDQLEQAREDQTRARNAQAAIPNGLTNGLTTPNTANLNVYDDALAKIARAYTYLNSTASKNHAVADAISGIKDAAQDGISPVDRLQAALDNLLTPEMDLVAAQDQLTTGLRHIGDSLDKNNKSLSGNSDAAIKNRAAVSQQVTSITSLLTAQAKAGQTSDQLSKTLSTQRGNLIDAGVAAGISRTAMVKYVDQLHLTPKLIQTLIDANTTPAMRKLAALRAALDYAARPRQAVVTVVTNNVHRGGNQIPSSARGNIFRFAQGGDIPGGHQPEFAGPGPTRVWREPETGGESYIPHANDSRRPRAKAITEQTANMFGGRVQWFADGGLTRGPFDYGDTSSVGRSARDTSDSLRGLKGRIDDASKSLDKQKSVVDSLRSKEQQLASSVTDGLRSDIFASSTSSNIYAAGATANGINPMAALKADIANAKQYRSLDKSLIRRGLSGGALAAAEAAGLPGLQSLAGDSRGQLKQFERAYAERQRLTGGAGRSSGSAVYGQQLAEANHRLDTVTRELKHLRAEQKREHQHDRHDGKKNSDDNANKVGKNINGASARGSGRRAGGRGSNS